MPHSVRGEDEQEARDDAAIENLLSGFGTDTAIDLPWDRELEPGEKADDAEDYEDIGDDDLEGLDEDDGDEPVGAVAKRGGEGVNGVAHGDKQGKEAEEPDLEDLFGEEAASSSPPHNGVNGHVAYLSMPGGAASASGSQPHLTITVPARRAQPAERSRLQEPDSDGDHDMASPDLYDTQEDGAEEEKELDDDTKLQMSLFEKARKEREERQQKGLNAWDLPEPPETDRDLFETMWPQYQSETPLRHSEILPHKRAFYLAKTPLKPPRPVQPTKVSLDVLQDQERTFKLSSALLATKSARQLQSERSNFVRIEDSTKKTATGNSSDGEIELDEIDDEMIGGVTWQDLNILCADWEVKSVATASTAAEPELELLVDDADGEDEWAFGMDEQPPPAKKRKVDAFVVKPLRTFYEDFPSLDDPEVTTARLAKRPILDLNDPHLLIDVQHHAAGPKRARKIAMDVRRDVNGNLSKSLFQRFNISNDAAYDALKENHQHKVRTNISNLTYDHALPAVKLQYPFYKVKLEAREARTFHKTNLHVKANERAVITKNKFIKKKHIKGQAPKAIFATAEDLTLADNSTAVLFEYSEEQPTTLSNLGMHNRLVNYYRRKDAEDTLRPKVELGELTVLLTQDSSPFSIFGSVDPGEIVPTLQNAMYRAPVFKHKPASLDFLVCRSTTGVSGSSWHIRNIEHLMAVGQEYPLQEVPGTHSRKVTDAAKNRLKTLSYRIFKKNARANIKGPYLSNEMIRDHLPGTDIAQNRGKMREFMAYDKEVGSWKPKPGQTIPEDEDNIRAGRGINPEHVCLLDSMQVGNQHLQDSGYSREDEDDEDEDREKDGQSLEQQLAPWNTTKNFLNACSGKAMLQVHGEGDPTGRGEALNFMKTSMKGGFRALGESIEDRLDARRLKENNGHSYNVAKQQRQYEESIRKIWEAQKNSLSSEVEPLLDVDLDNADVGGGADSSFVRGPTPQSAVGTPAGAMRRDDDTMSQFSRTSAGTATKRGSILKIVRKTFDKYGEPVEEIQTVDNPKVINEYLKRRRQQEISNMKYARSPSLYKHGKLLLFPSSHTMQDLLRIDLCFANDSLFTRQTLRAQADRRRRKGRTAREAAPAGAHAPRAQQGAAAQPRKGQGHLPHRLLGAGHTRLPLGQRPRHPDRHRRQPPLARQRARQPRRRPGRWRHAAPLRKLRPGRAYQDEQEAVPAA